MRGGSAPSRSPQTSSRDRSALVRFAVGAVRPRYRRPVPEGAIDPGTAVLLGVVQGVTEFLPISSDGHLAVAALVAGETAPSLALVVLLHVGTLAATLLVFRAEVRALVASLASGMRAPRAYLETVEGRTNLAIVVATVPTALVGLALRDAVEAWARVPWIVGGCLLGTAAAVGSTFWTGPRAHRPDTALSPRDALLVGLAQGLAVLPGLSRSGTTIAAAVALGTVAPAAFRLSFLLSLPAVFGAVLLELRHPSEVLATLGPAALLGAAVSFVVGLGALLGLRRLVDGGRFWVFAVYLVPLGLVLLAWRPAP